MGVIPFNTLSDLSQVDVRLRLARQDATELRIDGMSVPTDISPSAMIHMGLELEELQLSHLSPSRTMDL